MKGNIKWDEEKYRKYKKEGRGAGEGQSYKPWIQVHEVPSLGRSTKTPGWKTNRLHHFLSDNELRYFFLLEWSGKVIDIQEQYPLLEVEETVRIANDLGIDHPCDKETGFPYVLTTDFLITLKTDNGVVDNGVVNVARTIKPYKKLDGSRLISKLEIERRYWASRGIDWAIVTEKEIPKVMAENIEWIHSAYWLEPTAELSVESLLSIAENLKVYLRDCDDAINMITSNLDKEMNLEAGTSLYLLRYLIA